MLSSSSVVNDEFSVSVFFLYKIIQSSWSCHEDVVAWRYLSKVSYEQFTPASYSHCQMSELDWVHSFLWIWVETYHFKLEYCSWCMINNQSGRVKVALSTTSSVKGENCLLLRVLPCRSYNKLPGDYYNLQHHSILLFNFLDPGEGIFRTFFYIFHSYIWPLKNIRLRIHHQHWHASLLNSSIVSEQYSTFYMASIASFSHIINMLVEILYVHVCRNAGM